MDSFRIDQSTSFPARNAWVPRRGLLTVHNPPILLAATAPPTPAFIPPTLTLVDSKADIRV